MWCMGAAVGGENGGAVWLRGGVYSFASGFIVRLPEVGFMVVLVLNGEPKMSKW